MSSPPFVRFAAAPYSAFFTGKSLLSTDNFSFSSPIISHGSLRSKIGINQFRQPSLNSRHTGDRYTNKRRKLLLYGHIVPQRRSSVNYAILRLVHGGRMRAGSVNTCFSCGLVKSVISTRIIPL
jgi:hypothetical protein